MVASSTKSVDRRQIDQLVHIHIVLPDDDIVSGTFENIITTNIITAFIITSEYSVYSHTLIDTSFVLLLGKYTYI